MLEFRARPNAIEEAAEEAGIPGHPSAIAGALGMSHETVRRAVRGIGAPSAKTMATLASGLNTTVERLFHTVEIEDEA